MSTPRLGLPPLSPRWRRGLVGSVLALLLLELLYNALLLNGWLGTWLTRDIINTGHGHTLVRFTQGWSVVPGRVHVRELTIQREESDGTRWSLDMERVETNISLLALFRRELRTSFVEVWGLTVHVQLPDTSDSGPPSSPEPDAFGFTLHDVHVHDVREFQWNTSRFTGLHEVTGSLDLKPGQHVFIQEGHAVLGPGEFFSGPTRVARVEGGSASVTLEVRRQEPEGLDLITGVTEGRVQLAAELPSLEGLKSLSRQFAALQLKGGAGHLDVDLHVKNGRLAPGTKLVGSGEPFVVPVVKPLSLQAPWKLDADVYAEPGGEERFGLELKLGPVRLVGRENQTALESQQVVLALSSKPPRLGEGLPDVHLRLRAARSKPLDLRALNGWFSPSFQVESGHLTLEASSRSNPDNKELSEAHLLLTTEDVLAHWGGALVGGRLELDVDAYKLAFLKDTLTMEGSRLLLRGIHVRTGSAQGTQGWDGTLTFPQATLSLSPFAFSGRFSGSFSSAAPFVSMLVQQSAMPRVLAPLLEAHDLKLEGAVTLGPRGVKLEHVHARGEGLEVHAKADTTGEAARLWGLVKLGALPLGVEKDAQGLHFQVFGPAAWYEQRTGEKLE